MSKQPEALRLADALDRAINNTDQDDDLIDVARWFVTDAACELRRLHAENEALRRERYAAIDTINMDYAIIKQLRAQRNALLDALKFARSGLGDPDNLAVVDAAIARAGGAA